MTTVNVYLTFDGNCEEAFEFYKSVFGGEFSYFSRFKEIPPMPNLPPPTKEQEEKIMHVSLPISNETILMGSDIGGGVTEKFVLGNNFSVSINTDKNEKADCYFAALANGGTITMPMDNTFWGAYFGMVKDKFGINWMVSVEPK